MSKPSEEELLATLKELVEAYYASINGIESFDRALRLVAAVNAARAAIAKAEGTS